MANTYTFDIKLEVLLRNALAKEYPGVGMDKLMAAAADGAKATIQSITQRQALLTPGVRALTLLDLTPSIRQKIYHQLFFTNPTTKPLNPLTGIAKKQPPPPQPPITRTNRLLRAEALPLFYALTHFTLDVTATTKAQKNLEQVRLVQQWLLAIGEGNRGLIRRLDVRFDGSWVLWGSMRIEDVLEMVGWRDVKGVVRVWEREGRGEWKRWVGPCGPRRIVFED